MRHPDIGRKLLDGIAEVLKGIGVIERTPVMEGKMMSMIVSRAPGWEPPKKQAPAPAPAKKHQAHHTEDETAPAAQASTGASQATPEPVLVPEERESERPPLEES